MYSKHHTRFMSNVLLLIIGKASVVAFMQISKGQLVCKGPSYVTGAGLLFSGSFCMLSFQGKTEELVSELLTVKQSHANAMMTATGQGT